MEDKAIRAVTIHDSYCTSREDLSKRRVPVTMICGLNNNNVHRNSEAYRSSIVN